MGDFTNVKRVSGTGEAAQGSADITIIAAPGAGQKIFIQHAVIQVTVAAASAGGEVALEDGVGGTRLFEADADAVGVHYFSFGDPGFPLTANTLLNVTVDGSGGNQATARATVTGIVAA